jgi:hypothetical protein
MLDRDMLLSRDEYRIGLKRLPVVVAGRYEQPSTALGSNRRNIIG